MRKDEIRKKYLSVLMRIPEERRTEAREGLLHLQLELMKYKKVFSFVTMKGEIDMSGINAFLESEGKLCLSSHEFFDCVLVPALAYDERGVRVGRGQGYYDKLLAKYEGIDTIGICFKEQLSKELLPREAHDQLVKKVCAF